MTLGSSSNSTTARAPPPTATTRHRQRSAPSRTYSEQVTRLFGTEREEDTSESNHNNNTDDDDDDDIEGSSSHNNSYSNGDYLYGANAGANASHHSNIHSPPPPTSTTPTSRSYMLTGSSTTASATSRRRYNGNSNVNPSGLTSNPRLVEGNGQRRVSAPSSYSTTSTSYPAASTSSLNGSLGATHSNTTKGYSSPSSSKSPWWWTLLLYVLLVSVAGFGLGVLRQQYVDRQALHSELQAAVQQHDALHHEVQELELQAEMEKQRAVEQEKLESSMQLLNLELEETERSLAEERTKLEHRTLELERLARAQQATAGHAAGSGSGPATSSGHLRQHYDTASDASMGTTTMMMMNSIPHQQQVPPVGAALLASGGTHEDESMQGDSLVGRLVQTLGVEHYGLRPLHVELHLEYHHQSNPTSKLSNSKKTTIHRRYVTAQLSLLQRPITTFVFLQQVEHDLYDHVTLLIEKSSSSSDNDDHSNSSMTLRTDLSERQWQHRKALGLAHVPVRELGSYTNPLLLTESSEADADPRTSTTNETNDAYKDKVTSKDKATSGLSDLEGQDHHYHLALTDDGDLVISTSVNRPGVFATLVHGGPVLDKLLMARSHHHHNHNHTTTSGSSGNTEGAASSASHSTHHHHHRPQHVELISIRLLSSLDDEEHHPSEDDDDFDDYDDEDEEHDHEEGLLEWLHDEH